MLIPLSKVEKSNGLSFCMKEVEKCLIDGVIDNLNGKPRNMTRFAKANGLDPVKFRNALIRNELDINSLEDCKKCIDICHELLKINPFSAFEPLGRKYHSMKLVGT